MKIAVDYDQTYTAAPELFTRFIQHAIELGHEVKIVTYRQRGFGAYNAYDNADIEADAAKLGIEVIYSNGMPKRAVYNANIWIDDMPETIVNEAGIDIKVGDE